MSTQIAVRLPDNLMTFIDEQVGQGKAASRAALVLRALERERRRIIAERDIALYQQIPEESDDLAGLAEYASRTPMDDLD
ncbi:MAG: YlcI/YnfO family protein [Micromonosporaceae bacterium]